MSTISERIRGVWNAFLGRDPTSYYNYTELTNVSNPYAYRYTSNRARSVIAGVYNRIAVDVSEIKMVHASVDENSRYKETINSSLNYCLNVEANIDQTSKALRQDIVESMFDEGVVAVVPVDTEGDPIVSNDWEVLSLRTASIVEWFPQSVKVHLYNDATGQFRDIILPKSMVAIIPNPFYSTMNEPNSTLQRLLRTISKLDAQNEKVSSNKLNMLIELPYVLKTPQKKLEANKRRAAIEKQLDESPLGIAYIDGTEKVIQLNRPIDANLWEQVKELTIELFNKLGVTQAVLDGTADEATMINYYNNTISPICSAIADEFKRKFLHFSIEERDKNETIYFYRNVFKLSPVSQIADIADKFRRNEIMTSNELRGEMGMMPSSSPKADVLDNPNINSSKEELANMYGDKSEEKSEDES